MGSGGMRHREVAVGFSSTQVSGDGIQEVAGFIYPDSQKGMGKEDAVVLAEEILLMDAGQLLIYAVFPAKIEESNTVALL